MVSMRFIKANAQDIIKIINNLSDDKSPGCDGIRVKDIKYVKSNNGFAEDSILAPLELLS